MELIEEQKKELGYWTMFWDLITRETVEKKDLEELPDTYKKLALELLEKSEKSVI